MKNLDTFLKEIELLKKKAEILDFIILRGWTAFPELKLELNNRSNVNKKKFGEDALKQIPFSDCHKLNDLLYELNGLIEAQDEENMWPSTYECNFNQLNKKIK